MNRPIGSGWPAARARREAATIALMQREVLAAEGRMRITAGWTDRTGVARQALSGEVVPSPFPGVIAIAVLSHGVGYGRWLSTIHGAAMGRRAQMSPEELVRPEYAGPLDPIHPAARETRAAIVVGVGQIWGAS